MSGFNSMFAFHGILMLVMMVFGFFMFALVLGIIIFTFVRAAKRERQNDHSPRIAVPAAVVAKRTELSHRHRTHHHTMYSNLTTYYATFQLETGDRIQLQMTGEEYGWLVEGDRGTLTFQGTRYLGFERS